MEAIIHPALSALERISDGVFSIDLKGQITYINQSAAKLIELAEPTQTGNPISRVLPDEIADKLEKKINQAIRQQSNTHFELQTQSSQWLEVHIYPSEDGATVFLRDITPKKQIEETIQVQHERLLLLTEAANHLFYKKEPKALLDALFHDLAEYLDLDVYFNYLYDPETNKIRLMNYSGIPETTAKEIEWLELGEAVCGCVARDRQRIVAEKIDTSDDVRVQLVKGWGIKAYACHPLMSYGKLIGTLSFGSSKRSHFTEEEA
ncbi:GAF domain-containing protein [Bacillus sp. 1P10SD]|uniref:GAF domain-containing protein n=1 Tax=Bacillus sp. 1P10SD TaxID=3132265 RepID=UPI0039A5A29E